MPVDININSKVYKIGCAKEDEERVLALGLTLSKKITEIKKSDPNFFIGLNNETLFLFTALILIEEQEIAKKQTNTPNNANTAPNVTQNPQADNSVTTNNTAMLKQLMQLINSNLQQANVASQTVDAINQLLSQQKQPLQ